MTVCKKKIQDRVSELSTVLDNATDAEIKQSGYDAIRMGLLLDELSVEAVNNIDDLLAFDEVDGVMIGPMDLSGSLGIPGKTNHPDVIQASSKVIKACEKYGKSCGTIVSDTTKDIIKGLFDLGYTFAILGSDLFVLWRWADDMKTIMEELKK